MNNTEQYLFTPNITNYPVAKMNFDEGDFVKERAIYGGTLEWTNNNADPITRAVLTELLSLDQFSSDVVPHAMRGYHPVIDTRVTMMINENFAPVDLMGEELEMYQAIAGWHCDGVPRKKHGSQPDLSKLGEPVYHYIFSLSSTDEQVSPTGLINTELVLDIDVDKGMIWDQVNKQVKATEKVNPSIHTKAPDNEFTRFSRETIHCSNPSKVRGFRYFFRCSFYHMPAMNQFRANNNVYLVPKGW
jgi:hypothetical protein